MAHRTPEELRHEVHKLLEATAETDRGLKRQELASLAFALAQEAEALERTQQDRVPGPK